MAVHPRAYGEYEDKDILTFVVYGSSPCLRGIHLRSDLFALCGRFIPVLTGNAISKEAMFQPLSVYPRAYGECITRLKIGATTGGLSPCLRGMPTCFRLLRGKTRFIPVLTGNAHPHVEANLHNPVYPRAYGECDLSMGDGIANTGLSPCLRGMRYEINVNQEGSRFIPVLTGNAQPPPWSDNQRPVYPRAYGECSGGSPFTVVSVGLSPCLRGMLISITVVPSTPRFIPVLTGNA